MDVEANTVASSAKSARRSSSFTLGGEQAEADPLLQDGFYESAAYLTIAAHDDPRCFLVGRTGVGKSALLQRLEEDHSGHVIRISPENLSLPYIADLNVVRYLTDLQVHLDPLFIALWKHVFLIEVIKNRYHVDSPTAKQNFISNLRSKIAHDKSKIAALEYLEEFEGKFWCETDERVRDITTRFESQIEAEAGGKIGPSGLGSVGGRASSLDANMVETRVQQAERFQRIVNATQLPRLNQMINVLDEDILDSGQHFTYVVIDDLDRDWADEQVANALIRCLFRAVIDLKRVRNLKVIVALRTNIFEALDFGAKTGGQEEKFRSLTLQVRWTNRGLEDLLSERARASANHHNLQQVGSIRDLLPATNKTRGNALDYILRRTLMRPRDAISYFNECYTQSSGKPKLSWEAIHSAEREYAVKRLLALRDEWKPNYPGLDRVFEKFTSVKVRIEPIELERSLEAAALLPAEPSFPGVVWMTELTSGAWASAPDDSWVEMYFPVVKLLYSIGFLGLTRSAHGPAIFAEEDPTFADLPRHVAEAGAFFVHPTFRAALDIRHDD
jgi:flagellar biosynthesis chaperone FliJ